MLRKPLSIIALLLGLCDAAGAASFESMGMVQEIDLGNSTLWVNGQAYRLPNRVPESLRPNGGPVIHQLQLGTTVSFSGDDASSPPTIESMAILRQPTPEDLEQLQRANNHEKQ